MYIVAEVLTPLKLTKRATTKLRRDLQLCLTAPIITNAIIQMINDIKRGYAKDILHTILVSEELRNLPRKTLQK